ncbi:MAG: hypothetical protein ACRDPV_14645 [Gaiellaceae bacterium]
MLALATGALGAASFSDRVGDNNAAPDVTALTISESAEAILTVSVTVANYQSLPLNSWMNLWFDLDLNRNTGDEGDEALVQYYDDGGIQFFRWSGSQLARRPSTGMSGSFAAGVLTLTIPRTSLDSVASFGVLGVSSRGQDDGDDELTATDYVPNSGNARYASPSPLSLVDAAGDQDAAPDIEQVEVSDTKAGTISFAISTPSHTVLAPNTWVELDFDIDRRRATGDNGVEAYVYVDRSGAYVGRWSPTDEDFVEVRGSGVQTRNAGGVVTIAVPRRLLDDVAGFDFYLVSGDSDPSGDTDFAIDLAPNGDAWWRYTLVNKAPLRLISGDPSGAPARPRAGKLFTVTVPVRRSDTARGITSGSVTCSVRVGGTVVKAPGRVAAGGGRCSLRVPADASRRVVQGSMIVRSSGKSVTSHFAFRVK